MMGPQPAEQVVLVIGTAPARLWSSSSGQHCRCQDNILVLPAVALRGDMLRRCHQVGVRPLIWTVDCQRSASLVIVSASAACTQSFLEYTLKRFYSQELDRIVVDEGHLSVTASDYRPCMSQLG